MQSSKPCPTYLCARDYATMKEFKMTLSLDPNEMVETFIEIARLVSVQFGNHEVQQELLPAPHRRPTALPSGTQVVYAFLFGNVCLKVGKAGPKTKARFTSQHYSVNGAPSTLAKSIINDKSILFAALPTSYRSNVEAVNEATVGSWIESNATRFHVFIPSAAGQFPLSLLEGFVQCRLEPIFEGKQP